MYADVIIYIAILYIPIFKIKYTWGREATIWKNGFLWLYFCFTKYFKPVKHMAQCGGPVIGTELKMPCPGGTVMGALVTRASHSVRDAPCPSPRSRGSIA